MNVGYECRRKPTNRNRVDFEIGLQIQAGKLRKVK
jgi:hypothetical protein